MKPLRLAGSNGDAVRAFIQELEGIAWFSSVGKPLPASETIQRVDFHFAEATRSDHWQPWRPSILDAEKQLYDLIIEKQLLADQMAIQEAVHLGESAIDFYNALDDQYADYYEETMSFPHEVVPDLTRLVRGAAYELLVEQPGFFTAIFPFFRDGFMPLGWEGRWPEGTLLLW
jgi:hypothetical protein